MADGKKRLASREEPVEPMTEDEELAYLKSLGKEQLARMVMAAAQRARRHTEWRLPEDRARRPATGRPLTYLERSEELRKAYT